MRTRTPWIVIACCAAIPLLNFPLALLDGRALFVRDVNTVWSPLSDAVARQTLAGHPPWFDERRAFGQPLFADPRAEVLYPPAWIHLLLPPERSYALFAAFHLFLAAWGAARLTRRLRPEVGPWGESTAALVFGAGGPMLSLVSHWHHLAAAALIPWILEAAEPDERGRVRVPGLAVMVALQIFAGSADYSFVTAVLAAGRALLSGGPRRGVALVPGFAAGLLLAGPQLLPALAFARDAAREHWPPGPSLSPLHPLVTLEAALPVRITGWPLSFSWGLTLFGGQQVWMLSHYLGFASLVAASLGASLCKASVRMFGMAAVAFGIVASWGVTSEIGQRLVSTLPFVSDLRFPSKALVGASLGLALLAAGAATPAAQALNGLRRASGLAGAAVLWLAALWFAATVGASPASDVAPHVGGALLAGLAIGALPGLRAASWLVPLIIATDLLGQGASLNPTTPARLYASAPPLTRVIPEGSRIYVSDYSIAPPGNRPLRSGTQTPYRLKSVPAGYDRAEATALAATWYLNPPIAGRFRYRGSFDLDILDFYRAPLKQAVVGFVTSTDAARVLADLWRGSVDYVVTMDEPAFWVSAGLDPVATEAPFFADPVRVFKVPEPWPFARLETDGGTLDSSAGVLQVLAREEGDIRLEVRVTRPTNVVVAVANDRGFRAFVDGAEAVVEDTALAFPKIAVGAGSHGVELRYRPPFLSQGLAAGALGLAWIVIAAVRARRADRELARAV